MFKHLPLFLQPKTMEIDVRHYFEAVDFNRFSETAQSSWKYLFGAAIEKKTTSLTPQNINKLDIAIIGAPFDSRKLDNDLSKAPEKIREELYRLSKIDKKLNIADFGNLKSATSVKGNFQAIRDIVEYFNELGVVIFVFGGW